MSYLYGRTLSQAQAQKPTNHIFNISIKITCQNFAFHFASFHSSNYALIWTTRAVEMGENSFPRGVSHKSSRLNSETRFDNYSKSEIELIISLAINSLRPRGDRTGEICDKSIDWGAL